MKIWLTEINAYNPATSAEITLYYCSGRGFITKPTEVPANTTYLPRILQPALVRRDIPIPGSTTSATRLSYGELTLANADGYLDVLTGYDFSGRTIIIRSGEEKGAYPGGYPVQLAAVVDTVRVGMKEVAVKIKSPRINWEQPVATLTYGGTNAVGGTGIDGDLSMAGTAKPLVVGYAAPVAPVLVNSFYKIYQYHVPSVMWAIMWSAAAVAVADGGVALLAGPTYADSSAMYDDVSLWGATVGYRLCPSEGLFRLRALPTFTLSCSITPATSLFNCLDALVKGPGGFPSLNYAGYLSASGLTMLSNLNACSGAVVTSGKSLAQLMDDFTLPVGCWWGFTAAGSLQVGCYLYDLAVAATSTLTLNEIVSFERDTAPLYWRVILRNNHNIAVQTSGLAPAATLETKQAFSRQWNELVMENATFKSRHPAAGEFVAETMLYQSAAALPTLWPATLQGSGAGREILKITARMDAAGVALLDLGKVVTVKMPRLGYAVGKNFLVCGMQTDAVKNRVDLTLWG